MEGMVTVEVCATEPTVVAELKCVSEVRGASSGDGKLQDDSIDA